MNKNYFSDESPRCGTTALVAKGIGRELNPEYKAIAERRLFDKFGIFM